jgi:tagatose 6-phosphate kinase
VALTGVPRIKRLVGVALNAAVDKTVAVERLRPGEIHRPQVLAVVPGGKAANTVRAAAHLGIPGTVVAVLGGHAGVWYAAALRERGVALEAVDQAGETRTCLSVLDRSAGRLTELYEPGLELGAEAWPAIENALQRALASDPTRTLVVLAGSLPPGTPEDAYRSLGRLAAEQGAMWSVDIAGASLIAALDASPWLVKLNQHEAAETTGAASTSEAGLIVAARRLRSSGAANVLITRGPEGSILATEDGVWRYGPPPVPGPYPVGSGDALVAGLAACLARGQSLPDAARYAGAVAAANALVPGQGDFDPSGLDAIHEHISMERVDDWERPPSRAASAPG